MLLKLFLSWKFVVSLEHCGPHSVLFRLPPVSLLMVYDMP